MTSSFDNLKSTSSLPEPPVDDRLRALVDWWRGLGGQPPRWEGDHVQALKPWLGTLLVARYHGADEDSAHVTLYGTTLASILGEDLTGLSLREAAGPDDPDALLCGYAKARTSAKPHWCVVALGGSPEPEIVYQRLLLPFRTDGEDRMLAALLYQRVPERGWTGESTKPRTLYSRLLD